VRNYSVGGGFYLTTSQFGPNFYIGNNPRSDGTYKSLRFGRGAPEYERQDATELAEHALGRSLTPAEVSSYWTDRAMAFIASQPGAWLRLVGRKLLLLWNVDEMLDTESQETYAEWSFPLRILSLVGHFGVLAPLALFGAIMSWPDRRRLWVFYAMTAAYAASVIVFYVFARYRFPLVPFLILFASASVAALPARDEAAADHARPKGRDDAQPDARPKGRDDAQPDARPKGRDDAQPNARPKGRAYVLAGVAAGIAAVFTNWPVLSKTMMRAVTENNLATAFQEDGRLEDAIAHYRRAIDLQPDYAPAYNNLGAALRANGQVDEAVASYQRALAIQPEYPDAHYNLANALLEKNKPEEAAEHFRVALESIPGSAGTHNNLGIALASQGKLPAAVAEFEAALQSEPDSAKTHRNLGNVLSELGRRPQAIEHLRRAVALDPKDAAAHYDLASELLQAKQFAEAAAQFTESITIDPKSANAHNNLGIALASMNRIDEAINEFQRAVAIQPDFADAHRNLELARVQKKGAGRNGPR
jgi:tetratricopeptide (TPR) repeat protein